MVHHSSKSSALAGCHSSASTCAPCTQPDMLCVCVLHRTPTGCYGCRTMPVTIGTIRENTIALSGIQDEDLLFFSHSNEALSHLPYMVALER